MLIQEIKEALAGATYDWQYNGNGIVSALRPNVGIGGFLTEEDNILAASAPKLLEQAVEVIEQQETSKAVLSAQLIDEVGQHAKAVASNIRLSAEKAELQREIERLKAALKEIAGYEGIIFNGIDAWNMKGIAIKALEGRKEQ